MVATSRLSLMNIHSQTVNCIHSINSSIVGASKIIYLSLTDNKASTCVTAIGTILYGALSYYEIVAISQIYEDINDYKTVFSLFSDNLQTCPVSPLTFNDGSSRVCLSAERKLIASLLKGRNALIKYIVIVFFKPLSLQACTQALTFALRSSLIKKWLADNNQFSLKILNHEISLEVREVIYEYSSKFIHDIIAWTSSGIEIAIAIGKAYDIYYMSEKLSAQGLEFDLIGFTALAIAIFLITNLLLNSASRKYAESILSNQAAFIENMMFNMNNALQVVCSQGVPHELRILKESLAAVTNAQLKQTILNTSVHTVSMFFSYFLKFIILEFSIPSLVKNPNLYFSLQQTSLLIMHLCNNIWEIFNKISSSLTLSYSYHKLTNLINALEKCHQLMLKRRDFKIITDPHANLYCELTISYPSTFPNSSSGKALINTFKKEFIAGKIYVITGPSGSGKSSFLNALFGINPYATGQVTITKQENIIYVPQKTIFKQGLSWVDTVLYPLNEKFISPEIFNKLRQKMISWTQMLELDAAYNNSKAVNGWVNHLSGGETQRLTVIQALARISLCRKKSSGNIVLLLDECLNALDQNMREKAFNLITTHVKKDNITAIHIDHSPPKIIEEQYEEACIISF